MNKVCVILYAALGNQLFMLFTAISKAIDENKEFSIYPIPNNPFKFYFTNFLKSMVFKIEDNLSNVQNKPAYEEKEFHYLPIPNEAQVIKGYFQSPKYFHHNKQKIIDILEMQPFLDEYQLGYKAIAIHLRFGDGSYNQSNHCLLKPSYFINAINKLIKIVSNIEDYKFLIFAESNDNLLVDDYINEFKNKINLKLDYQKFYELKPNLKDYEDLLYMSGCNHFIIANSTFSWFSAYLSKFEDKIVIYPNDWFGPNNIHKSTNDLFFDKWIKVYS